MTKQTSLDQLAKDIVTFRDEREWKQFHNAKDMALSLMLEASEVTELFQWKSETDLKKFPEQERQKLAAELSDVLYWVLLMANDAGIDLEAAFQEKMEANRMKYPLEKAKGNNKKYSEL